MQMYNIPKGTYLKGYKVQIFPNEYQKAYIERCFELVRYVWNWALEKELDQYQLYKEGKIEYQFLNDKYLLNLYKDEKKNNVFLDYLDYESARRVIRNLVSSYESFFRKTKRHPKFKSKKYSKNYLPLRHDRVYFSKNTIKIPGLQEKIITNQETEYILYKDNPKYYNCKITKDNLGNYWFHYSLLTNVNYTYFSENNIPKSEAIGIDLNKENTICCSNGIIYKRPNLDKINKRIKRYQRAVTKDIKLLNERQKELERTNSVFELLPSKNAIKRKKKYQKAYKRKYNIIHNFINQSIHDIIIKNPKAIIMEGLNVIEMNSKHYISIHIHDCNFGMIRDLMQYKCEQYNIPFFLANREFKSSQICSNCGSTNATFRKNHRIFHCNDCGYIEDRDLNAAKNLAQLAKEKLAKDYDYSFEFIA